MARVNLNTPVKTFSGLNDTDSIYYISPVTEQVEGFKIKEIKGATREQIAKAPDLKYAVVITAYMNVFAVQSENLEAIPTKTFVFDGREKAQLTMVKVAFSKDHQPIMPVVFFADIKVANQWKASE